MVKKEISISKKKRNWMEEKEKKRKKTNIVKTDIFELLWKKQKREIILDYIEELIKFFEYEEKNKVYTEKEVCEFWREESRKAKKLFDFEKGEGAKLFYDWEFYQFWMKKSYYGKMRNMYEKIAKKLNFWWCNADSFKDDCREEFEKKKEKIFVNYVIHRRIKYIREVSKRYWKYELIIKCRTDNVCYHYTNEKKRYWYKKALKEVFKKLIKKKGIMRELVKECIERESKKKEEVVEEKEKVIKIIKLKKYKYTEYKKMLKYIWKKNKYPRIKKRWIKKEKKEGKKKEKIETYKTLEDEIENVYCIGDYNSLQYEKIKVGKNKFVEYDKRLTKEGYFIEFLGMSIYNYIKKYGEE